MNKFPDTTSLYVLKEISLSIIKLFIRSFWLRMRISRQHEQVLVRVYNYDYAIVPKGSSLPSNDSIGLYRTRKLKAQMNIYFHTPERQVFRRELNLKNSLLWYSSNFIGPSRVAPLGLNGYRIQ